MNEKKSNIKDALLRSLDAIITELETGCDVELRSGPGGTVKVLAVKKKSLAPTREQ